MIVLYNYALPDEVTIKPETFRNLRIKILCVCVCVCVYVCEFVGHTRTIEFFFQALLIYQTLCHQAKEATALKVRICQIMVQQWENPKWTLW